MTAWDPQRTTGSTAGYAMRPPCRCRHSIVFHAIVAGQRRACSTWAGGGKCPCTRYQAAQATAGAA